MKHDKESPAGVTPRAAYHEYVNENLAVVEYDMDQMLPRDENTFQSRASLEEGVSGLKALDTTYENTSETIVQEPRSDWEDDLELRGMSIKSSTVRHPAPRPMDRYRYPHRKI